MTQYSWRNGLNGYLRCIPLIKNIELFRWLTDVGLSPSNKQSVRLIESGSVSFDLLKITNKDYKMSNIDLGWIVRVGKYHEGIGMVTPKEPFNDNQCDMCGGSKKYVDFLGRRFCDSCHDEVLHSASIWRNSKFDFKLVL
jgi:hypothetical protein